LSPVPLPAIVEDASKLATDVEQIAQAAIDRIKEILIAPLDRPGSQLRGAAPVLGEHLQHQHDYDPCARTRTG